MLSLSDFVTNMCGHQLWIFEDMRDECLKVLQDEKRLLELPASGAEAQLLDYFNNEETSNGIVYWLRLLASAFMRANPSRFEPYIPNTVGVDQYCKDTLEPVNMEIEHVGMTALIDVLLEPIRVAVKINYLDRSPGTKVNHYTFGKPDSRFIIHLLYRPGHYDIVYQDPVPRSQSYSKKQIIEAATTHSNPQINRATSFTHRHSIQSTPSDLYDSNVTLLASVPGVFSPYGFQSPFPSVPAFSTAPSQPPSAYPVDTSARSSQSISPDGSASMEVLAPLNPAATGYNPELIRDTVRDSVRNLPPDLSPLPPIDAPSPNSVMVGSGRDGVLLSPTSMSPAPIAISHPLSPPAMSPGTMSPSIMTTNPMTPPTITSSGLPPPGTRTVSLTSQFRPSMYQYKEDWGDSPAPAFQTSTFKNSHYNVSHYNNPNFQPEQWTPDCDEAIGRVNRRGTA
jgi:ubiquitin thioesterase protein OTUB1